MTVYSKSPAVKKVYSWSDTHKAGVIHTHTHTHTRTNAHTYTHTHTHTYIHTKSLSLFIFVQCCNVPDDKQITITTLSFKGLQVG